MDPAVGSVAVWPNGTRVELAGHDTYTGQTMFPGATGCPDTSIAPDVDCTYMKMGFYRKAAAKPKPFIVWHDDVRRFVRKKGVPPDRRNLRNDGMVRVRGWTSPWADDDHDRHGQAESTHKAGQRPVVGVAGAGGKHGRRPEY
jgi:hypothetical protein